MLDTDTKRRIDNCRDILVGKVPDPKSQVEQITIALIYKFMDDMDAEAEELGGKRKFFAGNYGKYGWSKLMSPSMGGFDILMLYSEAIQKMNENPGIPALFRDIFKNAYLPYRDPETLRSFLKEINGFTYDHSERLGDAFEYLLSVLGSQGDAGQFRTPRHIIEFIVDIIDPKKNETILDPACGTAGFLISSYKHILSANTKERPGDKLTPDERKRLAANIHGYDISPDMVRLSLVNLYLHGFANPRIEEYDTLTSEDKWNEYADIILANPPFMSPKGGIKPHKRFSVQASRSEVLFVDYIAEHLTPTGRAGIIVPEGIIFQSQTAYKQLREMLVKNSLIAVISLPAGVFNPYSGVKTSILILDKRLAKKSDSILFVKIENDGFGLGAQRRAIEKNDLTTALDVITNYKLQITNGGLGDFVIPNSQFLIVPKAKLAANGDYNLSGERYREGEISSSTFPKLRLGEVCTLNPIKSEISGLDGDTVISFVPMADLNEHQISFRSTKTKRLAEVSASYTYFKNNDVLLAKVTPCFENGKAGIARNLMNGIGFGSSEFYVLRVNENVLPEWIYFCITHQIFRDSAISQMTGTGGLQRVPRNFVENFQIPLPPLEIQKEIVAEIEGYQKVIDGARAVLENYRPHIPIHPDWPMVEFGKVVFFQEGPGIRNWQFTSSGIKLLNVKNIVGDRVILDNSDKHISVEEFTAKYTHFLVEDGDIILASSGATYGKNAVFKDPGFPVMVNTSNIRIHPKDRVRIIQGYIKVFLDSTLFRTQIDRLITGAAQPNFGPSHLKQIKIPLPPLTIQQQMVAEIEAEQALVNANKELITRFEKKIQKTIEKIWGEK